MSESPIDIAGDDYSEIEEFDDFIEDDLNQPPPVSNQSEPEETEIEIDRIRTLTTTLKPHESQAQKLLKAHIAVLVSALGGPDHTSSQSPPPYKLGHDALACLKDIKRWIKAVDERRNNYEVALACAESGLVANDILVILCQWDKQMSNKENIKNKTTMEKIMLTCLELLVLLTWPVDFGNEMSEQQKLLFVDLKRTHIVYKKHILGYNQGQVLKAVIRLALPVIAKSRIDREARDNQILKLVLYLIRNIMAIEPASVSISTKSNKQVVATNELPPGITQDDISLNNVLSVFKKNKVLMLLLTMSGSIGTEFDKDIFGEICLECIYLMVKGLKSEDILTIKIPQPQAPQPPPSTTTPDNDITNPSQPLESITTTAGLQLQDLLQTESTRKKTQTQHISTRHGRFGSLLSIRSNGSSDANSYVVSGQEALINTDTTLEKLDRSKKWNSRNYFKYDSDEFVKSRQGDVYLSSQGQAILTEFLESVLSGGCFNNLIEVMGSRMTSDDDNLDEYSKASYFFTIAWFLNYQRNRIERKAESDYGSVGAALSQVNFILIIGYFRESFSNKAWNSLHVAMICFRELLQISNSIFGKQHQDQEDDNSQQEIDRELAEGIMRKLFSFNDFLNILVQIPQTASKHSPDYLSVCISTIHILLKAFERFANEDIHLYIQSKRKKSHRKRIANDLNRDTDIRLRDVIEANSDESDSESATTIREITRERKLDFKTTEIRFFQSSIVTTYIEFLSRFADLSHREIKMCLGYFHRLFVIHKDFTGLYRLDFMLLLPRLRNHLPRGSGIRIQVEEFIYYFMKRFKVALARFPNPIEILFPRFEDAGNKTFLATGELYYHPEKESTSTRQPKLAKPLEFVRDNFSPDERVKILISALYAQDKQTFLNWIISEFERIISIRTLDSNAMAVINPGNVNKSYIRLFINNANLRLLLSTMGFELPFTTLEYPELPPSITVDKFVEWVELIKKWTQAQPVEFDDGRHPSSYLRVHEEYNDEEYNSGYDEDDEGIAFETTTGSSERTQTAEELDNLEELERRISSSSTTSHVEKGKAIRKKRSKPANKAPKAPKPAKKSSGATQSRRSKSIQKATGTSTPSYRSSEFVGLSDDESDDEKDKAFFEREERLRNMLNNNGGIVNAAQLAEFRKMWAMMEENDHNDSGNGKTGEVVRSAIERTESLFVNDDDDDSDGDGVGEGSENGGVTSSRTSDNEVESGDKRLASQVDGDDEEEGRSTIKRKRLIIDDDEDDD
ncbi:TOF1 [[Candida] subhashii]|uniref:Topoisomerase 1-associated factor 1 n=1 Tax=[Candida] subhashii TaxID=561895 RepID=A0A8J5UZJ2_9ASCO|nr:TOF1 [[Candida] subhashii]KAG7663544.1 TOF1 [[Candida] subhashii]